MNCSQVCSWNSHGSCLSLRVRQGRFYSFCPPRVLSFPPGGDPPIIPGAGPTDRNWPQCELLHADVSIPPKALAQLSANHFVGQPPEYDIPLAWQFHGELMKIW